MTGVLALAPALPLHAAGKYVAGAYIVFVVLLLVGIMASRLQRTERELTELRHDVEAAAEDQDRDLESVA